MSGLSPYKYQSLAPQYIRIIELREGPSDASLVCNIIVQRIDDEPYEAISYVWGDPAPVTLVKVTCGDQAEEAELAIADGLTKALVGLRYTNKTRRLWVDAICINQKDVIERQKQVRLMGAIYNRAERVLCWLGGFNDQDEGAEDRARLAFGFVKTFNENTHDSMQAARRLFHAIDDHTEDPDTALLDSWLAIKELFNIEYFHRAWVIQEVGLARHARFFWGTQDIWLDWTEVATFCRFLDDNGATVINHFELKSWVANHINLVWSTRPSGEPVFSFVEVLHWARVHRSTDPRDFIYALTSHPSAKLDGIPLAEPNYTVTTAQAYTNFAKNLIERTKGLQIMAFVDHFDERSALNLPTWVPDWHAVNLVAPIRCPTHAAPETHSSISMADSDKGMVLHCRSIFVDTLLATSDMIEPSGLIVTNLENEMRKKIPFLVDHIWRKLVVQTGVLLASAEEFIASISLVLTGGYRDDLNSTTGKLQEQQMSDCAALILDYERVRERGCSSGFLSSLSVAEKTLINEMASKGSAHRFIQDMTWTSMCRKVFRTNQGYFGLGPRIMRKGDVCAVIPGAAFPMVLRKAFGGFELVGPAVIYGFMNGEAEILRRNGVLLEQELKII